MNFREYDHKYARLLINKCLVNDGKKPLVIYFEDEEVKDFAELCYLKAKELGFHEVYVFNAKYQRLREYLKVTDIDQIKITDEFDRSLLEKMGKKEANYLYLLTFRENFWNDVDCNKYDKMVDLFDEQLKINYKNEAKLKCPWCVACYPNVEWAKKIFPDYSENKAYELLFFNIMKMCLCDRKNPEKEWDDVQRKYQEIALKLNDLKIKCLHYKNGIGTDLKIYLPDHHLWIGADERDYYGNSIMLNMPGYELYTSPTYDATEGIVYSTKKFYSQKVIDKFGLEFQKGAVSRIIADCLEDYEALQEMIESDDYSKYLGECAIVENNTPVNQTNIFYYERLYDENASCHLALGNSYSNTIVNGNYMSKKELRSCGLNSSGIHEDFMIGTDDMTIEADTCKGKKLIFSKGRFCVD